MSPHATPLKFLMPGWFAIVMGLCGLSLAWHRAVPLMGEMAGAGALVVGALAKASRDIALMMQVEVGEASEPSGPGRGSSSTMPHKRNPVSAALILSAAARAITFTSVVNDSMTTSPL